MAAHVFQIVQNYLDISKEGKCPDICILKSQVAIIHLKGAKLYSKMTLSIRDNQILVTGIVILYIL